MHAVVPKNKVTHQISNGENNNWFRHNSSEASKQIKIPNRMVLEVRPEEVRGIYKTKVGIHTKS